jgi:transcriptional regulator with XRE-family HTH domain
MFGSKLTQLRKKAKLTQEIAALKLEMPRSTYSNYESGKREPDFETTNKIAQFFDVSVDYLLGRTDDPTITLSDDAKSILEVLDLADDELKSRIGLSVDGVELSPEEVLRFVATVRAERQLKGLRNK